jgi:hypothetical protein
MSAHTTTTHEIPTKYTARHATKVVKTDTERGSVNRKVRIHVALICLAGIATVILVELHVTNPIALGFGPAAPSAIQEIFDWIYHL